MIPGFVIALLTFPGVIVHEMAHQIFCRLLGVPVFKVCYFRLAVRGPAGFVLHEHPHSPWKSLFIGVGPLVVNTLVGVLVALPAFISVFTFDHGDVLDGLLLWLGFSIAMHSFPSTGDAAAMWKAVMAPGNPVLPKVIGVPLIGLIWVGAVGSVFWLDAIYGGLVIAFVPTALVNLLS
jgi:hypothetical protein